MNNLTNYHSHCNFCDGKAPIEDFIKRAVDMGFSSYGVSSHAPVPFSNHWTMKTEDTAAYLTEMNRLKERYSPYIELYTGMEIDYLHETYNAASPFFKELALDYRIGSVHILYSDGKEIDIDCRPEEFEQSVEKYFGSDLQYVVTEYFDRIIKMIEIGGFDIIGHTDKITYNASACLPDIRDKQWYAKKIDELFECIAQSGLMMEINTKAYKKHGIFFPHERYFKRVNELNIPVTVNSDSHFPEYINDGRYEALNMLKHCGVKTVRQLIAGEWQDIAINI